MMRKEHEYFMGLALKLAMKGKGKTSPNPMVGALVVKNGKIIGKGFHQQAGFSHAEVIALDQAGVVDEMDRGDVFGHEELGRHAQEDAVNEELANGDVSDQRGDEVDHRA